MFCKKGVLKNLAKFTGRYLRQSLFFNKIAGRPATLLRKRIWHRHYPANVEKSLGASFLQKHLRASASVSMELHKRFHDFILLVKFVDKTTFLISIF